MGTPEPERFQPPTVIDGAGTRPDLELVVDSPESQEFLRERGLTVEELRLLGSLTERFLHPKGRAQNAPSNLNPVEKNYPEGRNRLFGGDLRPDDILREKGLTPRELEVLEYVSGGTSTAAIADTLFLTIETTRSHLKNIYRKIGVHSKAEAIETIRELEYLTNISKRPDIEAKPISQLTDSELVALTLSSVGLTDKAIGEHLGIDEEEIGKLLKSASQIAETNTRKEAAAYISSNILKKR